MRSREGTSWRLRDDLEPDRAAAVARLAAREPALDADASPPERLHPLCIALAVGGEEVRAERRSAWCHESGGADLLRIRPWDEPPASPGARFVGDLWLFW